MWAAYSSAQSPSSEEPFPEIEPDLPLSQLHAVLLGHIAVIREKTSVLFEQYQKLKVIGKEAKYLGKCALLFQEDCS